MKVLITGGAGYCGGALTDLMAGYEFRVYDNLTFEDHFTKPVPFVYGDVRDYKKLKEQLDWADAVVWLAGLVGDGACAIDPEHTIAVNQDAVKFLCDNFDGRIIFPSTCSVYGAQEGLLEEDSPTNPLSLYAITKLECEKYLKDKNALILRLGTLFGVGDNYSRIRLDLVVNTLTARASVEGKLTVFGGEQYRPLIHVRDVAQTMKTALETELTGIHNLAHENIRISGLAEMVRDIVPCEIKYQDMKFEDSRNYRVEASLPTHISVQYGIKQIARLFDEKRIKDPLNPRYNNYAYLSR